MKFEEVLPLLKDGYKIRRKCMSDRRYYHIDNNHIFDETGQLYTFGVEYDILQDDWEVIEEPKKVKLRDLTKEQFKKFCEKQKCESCLFYFLNCVADNERSWLYHKEFFSDKFLNQEIEVEEKKHGTKKV